MTLYELSVADLHQAVAEATELSCVLYRELPLVTAALDDWVHLALTELLTRSLGGDREEAQRRTRRARAGSAN